MKEGNERDNFDDDDDDDEDDDRLSLYGVEGERLGNITLPYLTLPYFTILFSSLF